MIETLTTTAPQPESRKKREPRIASPSDLARVAAPLVALKDKDINKMRIYGALRAAGLALAPNVEPVKTAIKEARSLIESELMDLVENNAQKVLRSGAAGGSYFDVTLTNDPKAVGYRVEMTRNYSTYKGAYKGWAANEDNHYVTVPADWRRRVHSRNLHRLGHMFTLDAVPLLGPDGVELFAAVWVSQSRGFDVNVHRGVIARNGEVSYHGDDVQSALTGLQRKVQATQNNRLRADLLEADVEDFCTKFDGRTFVVTLADAEATGACEYGIRSWCNATGLDYSRGKAPVSEILEAFRKHPMREARLAILHAARRVAAKAKRRVREATTQPELMAA